MSNHKWKGSSSWNRGQHIEQTFEPLLKQRDPNCRPSTLQEQYRHIDYHAYFGTIDVKAMKRVNRYDSNEQDSLVWVEFDNNAGGEGWLRGETTVIAFERKNDFVLVKRNILYDMAKKKCDLNNRVTSSRDALYKGYQRKGRKDLISIIKMSDILELPHRIWNKQ